jgi:putative tricarboxylic transport membrane protein
VLGPILEQSLYRALSLAHGSMLVFVTRPISATLLGMAAVMSIVVSMKAVKAVRRQLAEEEG